MTPAEIKAARLTLGLTQRKLGEVFGYRETDGRTVRRWENGGCPIPPAAALALRYMLRYGLPDVALHNTEAYKSI